MGAVGLVFAPLAPLVTLAAALVFWLCSWVYKYQLMFMFITHIESGGVSSQYRNSYLALTLAHRGLGMSLSIAYYFPPYSCKLLWSLVRESTASP